MKLEWNEYHARLTDDAAIGDALPFRVVLFRTQYTARQRACCGVTYLDLVTVVYVSVSMPQGSLIRALILFEISGQSRSPLGLMEPSAGHARRIYFGRRKRILFLFFSFLSLYHTPL